MSILDLVSTLNELDISVQIVENRLEFEAPDGIMTPELIDEIKENKEELIKFLSQRHEIKVYPTLRPTSKKEYYILSSPQKRMYLLQQLDLKSTAYNIPTSIKLDITVDKNILCDIFRKLIDRHDSLRSSFEIVNGEAVQRIHSPNDIEFRIENFDLKNKEPESRDSEQISPGIQNFTSHDERLLRRFIRPFDLSKAPLLRVGLAEKYEDNLLLIDMHHIISDGMSFRVLEEEIRAIIERQAIPALKFQYKDYAEWLMLPDYRKMVEPQEEYWLRKLSGDLPVIDFPTDYPRPSVRSFMGNKVRFRLSEAETAIIKGITKATGATVFMVILSLYNIMLSKLSGDESIIVGIPIAGRRHHYLERIIGMFVNTLALRSFPQGEKSYKEFLDELKGSTLEAFENQEYQFEELVEKLAVSRDTGRHPITDVLFNHLNQVEHLKDSLKLFEVEGYFHEEGISKFDLSLTTLEYEDRIYCSFEYCTQLFESRTIERFIGYFKKIISEISFDFERKIRDIRITPAEEMERILFEFNDTKADYPIDKPIQWFFEEQVERIPDNIALSCKDMNFSYDSLNRQVEQTAGALREVGIGSGSIAGIMVERSPEMVSGILGILRAAGAYLPIDPKFPRDRIYYILKDSRTEILLTTHRLYSDVVKSGDLGIRKVFFEELEKLSKNDFAEGTVENPAYVIYTSGSTGTPKGVPISHRSAVNILTALQKEYPLSESDTYLLKTSYIFDVSVTELFGWFFGGGRLSVLEKGGEKDPKKIIAAIQGDFITHINFVPSMFSLFLDELVTETISRISSLKYIFLAGEALLPELVKKIVNLDTKIVLGNIYGPTEGAVYSSNYSLREWDFRGSVPIGKPMQNIRLYILDKNNCLLPIGITGELCIAGENLAPGYLNLPELTAAKFVANLCDTDIPEFCNVFYRTGDLARWQANGNIEFLGRMDFQVKIRGFRIELGEIENCLLNHDGIRETVVTVKGHDAVDKYLCAYIVPENRANNQVGEGAQDSALSSTELRDYLSQHLPEYMIPAYFVQLTMLPLTPTGKVDRNALPETWVGISTRDYVPPADEAEEKLTKLWSDVLNIGPDERVGMDDNFFELGGHSLKALILISRVYKEFGVNIEIDEVFTNPTVRQLARRIKSSDKVEYISITPVEKKEYYELSFSQRRLWILCQFEEDSTAYNMPTAIILTGRFDVPRFEKALQTLSERHESLRTIFIIVDGEPKQKIIEKIDFEFSLEQADLRNLDEKAREEEARKLYLCVANSAFNLATGPLFRFKAVRLTDENYLFIFNIHHIVNDGWSQRNIVKEIITLYNVYLDNNAENPLPPLNVQYKDYSRWHNGLVKIGSLNESRQFWLEKFKDRPNGIDLPLDHSRTPIQTFNGGRVSFMLDEETISGLHELSLQENATLFMSLLTLVNIFLYKYTGQKDIIVGAPIAARKRQELYPVVGFLVNTLVYRSEINPGNTFREYLAVIKRETLSCYEHQDYPFDLLVEELELDRDLSQSPLFNVMLAHNNTDTESGDLGMSGARISDYIYSEDFNMSKFDLIFFMDEVRERLYISVEYNSDLLERSSIERMVGGFQFLVKNAALNRDVLISGLRCMTDKEYNKVVKEFNDNDYEFSRLSLQELFESQAEKKSEKKAVIGIATDAEHRVKDKNSEVEHGLPTITYGLLNCRINQFAHYLREEYQVKPNDVIGISMDRSIDMIVVLLGIIKSGAAYLAVDPTYPHDRVLHVLGDSQTNLLVIDRVRPGVSDYYKGDVLDVTAHWEDIYRKSLKNPNFINKPSDILYVNYTSGSTGTPNGAMLSHDCLTNLIKWQNEKSTIDCSLRVLQFTTINFCVSFQEIMGTLTSGGELHMIGDIERQDIDYLMDFLSEHQIEVLFLPFSYLNFLFNETSRWNRSFNHNLKHIITAGEQLKISGGLKKFLELNPTLQVHNHYGSTEMHVVTSYTLDASTADKWPIPPAGIPINNVSVYILDDYFNLAPIGVWGEIYVKGSSEFLGYVNNRALTDKKLLQHPDISSDGIKLYQSGDIGRWHGDGNIELRGRKDFQVKIRGFRVEPGEVEANILKIIGIKEAVVIDREDKLGNKFLCGYVVVDESQERECDLIGPGEIRNILAKNLPEYMIPSYIIKLESIPLTPNGKVDRGSLPEPQVPIDDGYISPRNELESELVRIWSEVLGINKGNLSIGANFFDLGGNSIKTIKIISRINKELELEIKFRDFIQLATIANLSDFILKNENVKKKIMYPLKSLDLENIHEPFPLTEVQLAYLMGRDSRFELGGVSTHGYFELSTPISIELLNDSLNKVIRRHAMLRAIIMENGQQRILEGITGYEIKVEDLRDMSAEEQLERIKVERERMSQDTFKPDQWPLFEIVAFKLPGDISFFCIGFDPLISDGTSIDIIFSEIIKFNEYPGLELPELEFSFRDYMLALQELRTSEVYKRDKEYWLGKLAGFPPFPALPLKSDPLQIVIPIFKAHRKIIPKALWRRLKFCARGENITSSALLCTIYAEVLAYWSNQPKLAVNLTVFNRYPFHEDVEKIVGDFTSLILLEIDLEPGTSFWDRAKKVQETIWDALEHRHYDGLEFMRELGKRDNIKNRAVMPIVFTSMLAGESADERDDSENESRQDESLDNESQQKSFSISQTSQVYIDYSVREAMGNLYVNWAYVENLFEPEVIDSMFAQNIMKITKLAQDEDISISRLIYEGTSLFDRYNSTEEEIKPELLHRLFSEQVKRTPANVAVEMGSKRLSYKELDEKSNQVARYLQENGVKRNDMVGVITSRDIDTIVNVMGILKSGGAYVPIDSEYPAERRNYIYNNSHCNLLLQENLYEVENLYRYSVEEVAVINKPEDIAYVIFTSGSTGKPKGVIITHRSASNTIIDINQKFSVNPADRILGISSMCFDLSVYDVFGALSIGAVLVLVKDQRDLDLLIDTVKEHKITIWNSVPAIMDMLVNSLENVHVSRVTGEEMIGDGTETKDMYYWSPSVYWNKTENTIKIGGVNCPAIALDLFPDLYFLTQKGITLNGIIEAFPELDREVLKSFVRELVDNRVLVNSILTPWEVFAPQKELFTNEYSEEILVNPVEYDKFKRKQLARRPAITSRNCMSLGGDWELPSYIKDRHSYRNFEEKRQIPFHVFSKLLSVFKQTQRDNSTHYYYASAGGLYPIDIYVYLKKGRIENMAGGLYYYSPVDHTVNLLDEDAVITDNAHYPGNKTIFNSSALSVFMIYNAAVTMPRYGGLGYFMAAIDTGIMVAAMTQVSELIGLGLCSIGDMYFDRIKSYFHLDRNQVFMHAVEVGLKPGTAKESTVGIPVHTEESATYTLDHVSLAQLNETSTTAVECESLRLVLLSGDWIPLFLPHRIKRYFPNAEVISLGGATEGSIWSIYYPVKEVMKNWKSIPYGYPLANQKFYVLNYEFELCPIGVQGELFIGGIGVAEGYANNILQTRDSFINHPTFGRIYRTGDYGIFNKRGYIEFLGRKDYQVKIQGYRIELGEIETCLLRYEFVKKAVVIDRVDSAGKKYLCAYMVVDHELPISQLRNFLSGKLPDYMIPSYFVYLENIPLTANGKVDRKALPVPVLKTEEDYAAPRDKLDMKLVDIWTKVLHDSLAESSLSIGIDDDFFALGGNSVKAILMISLLHKELNIKISVAEIFNRPTIRELSEYIGKTVEDKFAGIKSSEKKDYYSLSSAQKRFYILQHIGENNIALNLPQVMALSQDINMERLEGTFKELIKRHESLRTSFLKIDGMPVQKIHEGFHFSVEYFKLGEKQEVLEYKNFTGEDDGVVEESIKNFVRPFDLSKHPLLRVRLVKSIDNRQILLTDMHHIIADRISLTILEQEFRSIYSGHELEPLKLQYRDFVKWQNNQEKQESIKRQELYWLTFFSGEIPVLDFPTDYPGAMQHNYEGDEYSFGLNKELTANLKREIPGKDVTLFMVLIAAYYVLLSRLSGKDDIVIGVPVPGRSHDDLRKLIGMFVNIVAIRNRPRRSITFAEFLEEVKQNSLTAFSNQDFQFELIFDKLKLDRDLTRYPLFNTVFNMPDMGKIESKSISITKSDLIDLSGLNKKTSRYDISIYALDLGERIDFICTYRICLFKRSTIEYIMGEYVKLIEQILEDGNKFLKEYQIFV